MPKNNKKHTKTVSDVTAAAVDEAIKEESADASAESPAAEVTAPAAEAAEPAAEAVDSAQPEEHAEVNESPAEPAAADESPAEHAEVDESPAEQGNRPEEDKADLDIPAFANDPMNHIVDVGSADELGTAGDPDENKSGDDVEAKPRKHRWIAAASAACVVILALLGVKSCSQPYHVTYDNNDGTSYVASYKLGTTIDVDTIKKPVRKGYTFGGWYSDKELKHQVHTIDQSSNITLYAKWIPEEYTILYSGIPGGATVEDQDTYESGEHKVLPTYEKEHYSFIGWKLPGSDTVITELSGNETGNLTLEAVFEPETYLITYISDGITQDAPTTYQYGDSFDLPVSVLDGATFGGWYTGTDYRTQVVGITPASYGDLTLYAKFDHAPAPTVSADYSGIVAGKIAAVKNDLGVTVTADGQDEAAANALDIVYSSLSQYTGDARKKLGTVHLSDHDGLSGNDIYVNRSSSTVSKDFNANMFRILCGNKSDAFAKGWDDYTSYISNKAATGSVLDDAAETWGYHMAGVYGDDQVAAKFGILYNLYGSYLN